ncbi:hypothetical protein FACS1894196_5050 [Clostridia bacterium]|nr:hypothetical protein FACS1894196_5050 [Clostridia bacterium]
MKRIAGLLLGLLLLLGAAHAEIGAYTLELAIQPDGAGLFRETFTYAFDGAYDSVTVSIPYTGRRLENLRAFVDDVEIVAGEESGAPAYTAAVDGGATVLTVALPGEGGTRTVRVEYRVSMIATRYKDISRVSQPLLTASEDYARASLRISLPGSGIDDIWAFARGAMGAEQVTREADAVLIGPGPVAAGQKVEANVLFPQEWTPQLPQVNADMLLTVLAR